MSSDRGSQVWGPDPPRFNPRTPTQRRAVGRRADRSEPEVVEATVVRATEVEGIGTAGAVGDSAGPDSSEGVEGAEEIREEIEQTRAELSETIDAIQERLQPRNLVADAKEAAKDAAADAVENVRDATLGRAERMVSNVGETVGGAGNSIMDTIRANPVPAALAGIGLGWLFMKRGQSGQGAPGYPPGRYAPRGGRAGAGSTDWYATSSDRPYAGRTDEGGGVGETISRAGERAGELAGQARDTVTEAASEARERVGDLASTTAGTAQGAGSSLVETVRRNPLPAAVTGLGLAWLLMNRESGSASAYRSRGSAYDAHSYGAHGSARDVGGADVSARIGEVASGAVERAGDVRDAAVERAGEVGDQAQAGLRQARGQFDRWLYETPLAVGAAAVGLGAAVGLAVPGTGQESRLLGEARDSLLEKAQETVQETGQKVGRVAEHVQRTAADEARQQQLVS